MNEYGTIWTSHTEYVDIETGELIKKQLVIGYKKQFIKIKTKKNVRYNTNKTRGHITYTIECRRNPQRNLFE